MAHLPVPTPPSSGEPETHAFRPRYLPIPEWMFEQPNAPVILTTVRKLVADPRREVDFVFGAISEAAHSLSGSSGAAIALWREGAVICVGSSGNLAPSVGTKLNVDSGISGECLRTGKTLRCDDARKDPRADPEVCRQLGIRSIAAVALRGKDGTIGVLESFSTWPYAFAEEHMDFLTILAGLAETAHARALDPEATPESVPATESAPTRLARVRQMTAAGLRNLWQAVRKRRYRAGAAMLGAILLLSVAMRRFLRSPASGAARPQQSAQPQTSPAEVPEVAMATEVTWKPSPARPLLDKSPLLPANQAGEHGSPAVPDLVLRQNISKPPATAFHPPSARAAALSVTPESSSHRDDAPPPLPDVDKTALVSVLSTPVLLPKLNLGVSRVSGGDLVSKVQPIYPSDARRLRLQGSVFLQGTINEEGTVQDIKVIRGDPLLAAAAVDAVRQWVYRPYLLNRRPTRIQTEITVNFKLP